MTDWAAPHSNLVEVEQVAPTDLSSSRGPLEGVDLSASRLSCGYYTDARTSGQLVVRGGGYVRGSFLRLTHRVPEWGYSRVLGTYAVADDDASRSGAWASTLELRSALWCLSEDYAPTPWTLGAGASALAAMRQMLEACQRPYAVVGTPPDAIVAEATVFESGGSYLSRLYRLASMAGCRLDVDPMGRVTISAYREPAARTPVAEVDLSDPRGMASADVSRSTNRLSMLGRVIVSHREGDAEVTAVADASGTEAARGVRGYMVSRFVSLAEMSPPTQARANELVSAYLARASHELVEWELTCRHMPLWEGDVVDLVLPSEPGNEAYAGRRRCLVKSVDVGLAGLSMGVTLKEVASGDWEDDGYGMGD